MLKEYVPDDHIALVRFPDYNWGPEWGHNGPAYADSLTYKIIPEDLTRGATLKTTETNIVDSVRSHEIPGTEKDGNFKIAITPVAGAPGILLALIIVAILGTGLAKVQIAVGVSLIPAYARLVR